MERKMMGIVVGITCLFGMVACAGGGSGEDDGDVNPEPDTGMMEDVEPDTRMPDTEPDVPDVDAPQIASFEVFQSIYSVGDTVRLEWSLEGGMPESVTLSPDVGDVTGETAANVEVTGETTYTLTASNEAGDDESTLTLMPEPRGPSVDNFGASTQTVQVGESLTFNWSVSSPAGNTVECELDVDDDGTAEYTILDCEATTSQAHSYLNAGGKTAQLTATTSNGEDSQTFSVTVEGSSQVVSNTNDSGQGSLREAVTGASSGDVILFDLSSYPATIELQSAIEVASDVTIRAPARGDVAVSGRSQHRVFDLNGQGDRNLVLENMELMNGLAPRIPTNNGGYESTDGGLIRGLGTLTIENSFLHDSTSIDPSGGSNYLGDGGCLQWSGDVTISGSEFRDCVGHSGAAFDIVDSEATIEESTIASNHSPTSNAGCCFVRGTLDLIDSTVVDNEVRGDTNNGQYGGAFYLQSDSSIGGPRGDGSSLFLNSTIAGNGATANGGVALLEAPLHVVFSTVTNNAADDGIAGGGFNSNNSAGAFWILSGEVRLHNSIVSGNSADEYSDIEGPVVESGKNFVGDVENGESPNLSGRVDTSAVQLGAIGQNGGPTQTIVPTNQSPVIDAAPSCDDHTGSALSTDQRGSSRPSGGACDVGSVEVQ